MGGMASCWVLDKAPCFHTVGKALQVNVIAGVVVELHVSAETDGELYLHRTLDGVMLGPEVHALDLDGQLSNDLGNGALLKLVPMLETRALVSQTGVYSS